MTHVSIRLQLVMLFINSALNNFTWQLFQKYIPIFLASKDINYAHLRAAKQKIVFNKDIKIHQYPLYSAYYWLSVIKTANDFKSANNQQQALLISDKQ